MRGAQTHHLHSPTALDAGHSRPGRASPLGDTPASRLGGGYPAPGIPRGRRDQNLCADAPAPCPACLLPRLIFAVSFHYHLFRGFCQHPCARAWPLSRVQLFATPWTVARQAPLSMGFPRQEYWSGVPLPPPGDLPNPGIELTPTRLLHCRRMLYH